MFHAAVGGRLAVAFAAVAVLLGPVSGCTHDASKCSDAGNDCCEDDANGTCSDTYMVLRTNESCCSGGDCGKYLFMCCPPAECEHDETKCSDILDDCCEDVNTGECKDGYLHVQKQGNCNVWGRAKFYECLPPHCEHPIACRHVKSKCIGRSHRSDGCCQGLHSQYGYCDDGYTRRQTKDYCSWNNGYLYECFPSHCEVEDDNPDSGPDYPSSPSRRRYSGSNSSNDDAAGIIFWCVVLVLILLCVVGCVICCCVTGCCNDNKRSPGAVPGAPVTVVGIPVQPGAAMGMPVAAVAVPAQPVVMGAPTFAKAEPVPAATAPGAVASGNEENPNMTWRGD